MYNTVTRLREATETLKDKKPGGAEANTTDQKGSRMSKKHNGYKKQSNALKPIGRIPDEQWKYLKPIIDRIDAEEETRDPTEP